MPYSKFGGWFLCRKRGRPLFNKNRIFLLKSGVGASLTFMAEFSDFRSSRLSDVGGGGGVGLDAGCGLAPPHSSPDTRRVRSRYRELTIYLRDIFLFTNVGTVTVFLLVFEVCAG